MNNRKVISTIVDIQQDSFGFAKEGEIIKKMIAKIWLYTKEIVFVVKIIYGKKISFEKEFSDMQEAEKLYRSITEKNFSSYLD